VGFGALAKDKPATLPMAPDIPHAFAFVPDIGPAVGTLLDAPDDAYEQAWQVPCGPTVTPRRILELDAAAIGNNARIKSPPLRVLPAIGTTATGPQPQRPRDVDAPRKRA
jgi:hypothetical protein